MSALKRLRQEDCEFEAILGSLILFERVRPSLKQTNKQQQQ
jgi:hypothetical protein